MAATKISDILTPDVWNAYGAALTAEKSAFWQAGVVSNVEGIQLPRGGATINMPYFGDISGDLQTLDDAAPLTVNKITAGKQVAVVVARGQAWGVNDLAPLMAGSDPAGAILNRVAAYWAREYQKELIQTLGGVFSAASMAGNVHDISALTGGAQIFGASTFIDACYKLGDAADSVSAIAMHSAVMAKLAKDQLITYQTTADKPVSVPFYMGKRVIVDDGLPVATGTYTSYIFGGGAVGYVEGVVGNGPTENDRDILAGEDVITMRRRWIMHVRGTKWKGTPAGDFPTRTELATGTNWERVFENKQIPVVQFKTKLA
ncbi:MAG: coat protein [Zoogloeaceae bacterium]|nr:coat protein [Zoogloeaceae bacterium]